MMDDRGRKADAMSAMAALVLGGGGLILACLWGLHVRAGRHERRGLASAFVGEIVAILRAIEMHDIVPALQRTAHGEAGSDLPVLNLPPPTVYDSMADRLDRLDPPLPRQVAFFYTRLLTLLRDLEALGNAPSGVVPLDETQRLLAELRDTLDLGDDILRGFQRLLNRRRLRLGFHRRVISTAPVYRKNPPRKLFPPVASRS